MRSGRLAVDSVSRVGDVEKFKEDFLSFVKATDDLHEAYEKARLTAIERLYFDLKSEVGI